MSQTANDIIMGFSGPPAAKFDVPGAVVKGQIVDLATSQQRDFTTQELKTWKDGSPMMQAIITVQTDHRDPTIDDDNGQRRIFVASKRMRDAVRDAVVKAGRKSLEVGGTIAIQYTRDGIPEGRGNPPKEYVAEYAAPAIGVGLLGGDSQRVAPAGTAAPAGTSLLG